LVRIQLPLPIKNKHLSGAYFLLPVSTGKLNHKTAGFVRRLRPGVCQHPTTPANKKQAPFGCLFFIAS